MKHAKILVIEDEISIRRFLKVSLQSNSYQVIEAMTGKEGVTLAASHNPDAIVLDIGLPDISGFEVIKQLREWSSVPIVILTVHDQEEDKVHALDLGADDYLTKPFGVPELLARIRVVLRRASPELVSDSIFRTGLFELDRAAHVVKVEGKEVHLTATEYDLTSVLVKYAGKVVTHRILLNEVWGPNSVEHFQYLRVHIGQIRKKLRLAGNHKELILTEPGVGYRLLIKAQDD